MADSRGAPVGDEVAAEELLGVVRVYADRVHDAVRRLGCSPAAAVEVVEASALDLVEAARRGRTATGDLVGWWFARARALGRRVADGDPDLPLGGGLLAADEDQQLLAEVLEQLPERERVALLLRDSYDLPAPSVGAALEVDADDAMALVGQARQSFLSELEQTPAPLAGGHDVALAALARLALPGPVAARDATPRRHAQSCAVCGAVLDGQERAHLLLAGISVAALPEADRDNLLGRVEARAQGALPPAAALVARDEDLLAEEDLGPRRLLTPLSAMAALLVALLAGLGLGTLLSTDGPDRLVAGRPNGPLPEITAPPAPTLARPATTATPRATPTPAPSDAVFTVSPQPRATTAAPTATTSQPPQEDPLTLTLDPSSGPNGATITVNGTGWLPGAEVTVVYHDSLDRPTRSTATAVVDERGRFTTSLAALDPTNIPGPHEVRARGGGRQASATYTADS